MPRRKRWPPSSTLSFSTFTVVGALGSSCAVLPRSAHAAAMSASASNPDLIVSSVSSYYPGKWGVSSPRHETNHHSRRLATRADHAQGATAFHARAGDERERLL